MVLFGNCKKYCDFSLYCFADDVDYTIDVKSFVIPAGVKTTDLTVTIVDDKIVELMEYFTIALVNITADREVDIRVSEDKVNITIVDNDGKKLRMYVSIHGPYNLWGFPETYLQLMEKSLSHRLAVQDCKLWGNPQVIG